jgi:hypothetical protein
MEARLSRGARRILADELRKTSIIRETVVLVSRWCGLLLNDLSRQRIRTKRGSRSGSVTGELLFEVTLSTGI